MGSSDENTVSTEGGINWGKILYASLQIFILKHVAVMLLLNVLANYDIWLRDPIFHHYAVYLLKFSQALIFLELLVSLIKKKDLDGALLVQAVSRNIFFFLVFKHKLLLSLVHNVFMPLTISELLRHYAALIDEKNVWFWKLW